MAQGCKKDITGQRFGRLIAIEDGGRSGRRIKWKCICDCGKETIVDGYKLRCGHTKSCGCYNRDILSTLVGNKHPMFGKKTSAKQKEVTSKLFKGKKIPKERIERIREKLKGRIFSKEHCKKISESRVGDKNHAWKGGISSDDRKLRSSKKLVIWRKEIFHRDNYTCRECGTTKKRLNAHHIKSWKHYPEYRLDIENGITLCVPCHHKKHPQNEAFIGKYMQS